jgi:superfamily II RNA helicase
LENRQKDPELTRRRRQRIAELAAQSPHIADHRQLGDLKHLGVGAHHSGQLPVWKLFLETLMTEGLLDAIFATSTVAAGVNFPARTVAFLNTDRFNGTEFLPLSPSEFQQMTGRAGRRGKDNVGFALAIPGKFMDLRLAARLTTATPSDVVSQIQINFSMVLNLLLSHDPNQVLDLLAKSLAAFQTQPDGGQRLGREFVHHLQFLTAHGYTHTDGKLTQDGVWASRLRVDQPLVIAEALRRQVFPQNDPAVMAAVMACFVNEQADDGHVSMRAVPKKLVKAIAAIQKSLKPFQKQMAAAGFKTRPVYVQPAVSLYFWAQGLEWEAVTQISEAAEGDLAMLILRTADHLRHIISLGEAFPEAAATAAEAVSLIIRDPVDMAIGF